MKNLIKWIFIILISFFIEIIFFKYIEYNNITPNLVICILVTCYFNLNIKNSIFLTVLTGLIEFALVGSISSIIAYILFIPTIKYSHYYFQRNCLFYLLNIFFCTLIYELFMFLWTCKSSNIFYNFTQISIQIVYNLLLGLIIYWIFEIFNINKKEIEYL